MTRVLGRQNRVILERNSKKKRKREVGDVDKAP